MLEEYDAIIQDQLRDGIVEKADMPPTGREFYIPHKAVVRENATSTKTRIVYDTSARTNESSPSLNDCPEVGPALQNQLWSVKISYHRPHSKYSKSLSSGQNPSG